MTKVAFPMLDCHNFIKSHLKYVYCGVFGSLLKNQNSIQLIIRSKHSCLLDFSLGIWKWKYINIIFPGVLHDCETWSLTLREKYRLRVVRRIFGEWRRISYEEVHSLYRSPNIVRVIKSRIFKIEMGRASSQNEGICTFKILQGKPTGKRPLRRPRRRWKNNIRMYLEEICINAGNLVDSAQDRGCWRVVVNTALNLRVP